MLLASGGILAPDLGLLAWTSIIFFIFWGLIWWKAKSPVSDMISKRNSDIQDALDEAEKARNEMQTLRAENEKMIAKAKADRDQILEEAKTAKEQIIAEAKTKAQEEADRIMVNAKQEIENQKKSAISDVKNESSLIALAIAENVIKRQLNSNADQETLANGLIDDIKLN